MGLGWESVRQDRDRTGVGGRGRAEGLQDGYFFAKFGTAQLVGAFEPSDAEITQFLASRPQKKLERPDWIEGVVNALPEDARPQIDAKATESDAERDLKIWSMHLEGKSLNEIQRVLFDGKTGGAYYNTVRDVIERYRNASTTSTTTQKLPSTGTLAA